LPSHDYGLGDIEERTQNNTLKEVSLNNQNGSNNLKLKTPCKGKKKIKKRISLRRKLAVT
jgi:hypothetical protein